jgi:hypothetical protein
MADRPLLALPRSTKDRAAVGRPPRESVGGLSSERQGARLGPKFERLSETLPDPARLAELRNDPSAIVPERALVFEVAGTITDFYRAVRGIGLEFLGEEEDLVAADDDFAVTGKADAAVPVRIYFTIPDERALRELVSLWQRFQRGEPLGTGRAAWRQVFEHLKDIRPWGLQDRLTTDAVQDWRERLEEAPERPVRFETEFWFRDNETRRARTDDSFRAMLAGLGGQLFHSAALAPIRYHAALAEVPANVIRNILDHPDVGLVTADDIMVLRPQSVIGDYEAMEEVDQEVIVVREVAEPLQAPVVALFDGLPMAQHDLLRGRLEIDDPDDFAAAYGAASEQRHGTAMASLIIHGDLDAVTRPIRHRLYVRPVTVPQLIAPGERQEFLPADQLGIDLMWRAFMRMLAGEGAEPASAPTVRVVNLSLGDAKRRFAGVMSPWGKLIDYISWTYKTLVLVSAGNILDSLPLPELATWQEFEALPLADREMALLKSLLQNRASRRLLSPSEAVNALTIGACHSGGMPQDGAGLMAVTPYESAFLPNASCAMGLGFRRAIKPEVFSPGGREQIRANRTHAPIEVKPVGSPNRYFGIRAASPGNIGATNNTVLYSGTSVAAALSSHDTARIIEALEELPDEDIYPSVDDGLISVIVKALLVHAAKWDPETVNVLKRITNPNGSLHWEHEREELTRILGYGRPDVDRVVDCAEKRATLIGWGTLEAEAADHFRVPLPPGLQGINGFRAVTITVAWLTPLNLSHRGYRMAKLSAAAASDRSFSLGVERSRSQPSHDAVDRGTIFHMRWEGSSAAPFVDQGNLVFNVGCKATAGELDADIPYGVAVSIEVGQDVAVPVYEEIVNRLRAAVRIPA